MMVPYFLKFRYTSLLFYLIWSQHAIIFSYLNLLTLISLLFLQYFKRLIDILYYFCSTPATILFLVLPFLANDIQTSILSLLEKFPIASDYFVHVV